MEELELAYLQSVVDSFNVLENQLPEECFLSDLSRRSYKAILKLATQGIKPNLQALFAEGIQASYASSLLDGVPNVDRAKYYREKILQQTKKMALVSDLKSLLSDYTNLEFEELLGGILKALDGIQGDLGNPIHLLGDLYKETIERYREYMKLKGKISGYSTGLEEIDFYTGGLQPRQLFVVGARPGQGKTTFLQNVAVNVAKKDIPVLFFSLEMAKEELVDRSIVMMGGPELRKIKNGALNKNAFLDIAESMERTKNIPFYIYDEPSASITTIRSKCHEAVRTKGVKAVFIDYIGKVRYNDPKMQRHEKIGAVVAQMKDISRELNIPVFTASQITRAGADRPTLKDLAGSTEIENEADVIFLISDGTVYVEKNRHGHTGEVNVTFMKEKFSFYDTISDNVLA